MMARDGLPNTHLSALLFFVAVTSWLTWPLTSRLTTGLSASPDALLNYWALAWNIHILPQALLAYFDANIFAPRPDTLAYSEHLFAIALLAWPSYLGTGSVVLAYEAAMFLSFVLSGLGMYLARDLTGNRWAAVVAGIVFLAAPYRFLHVVHIQILTLQWFPFLFSCLLRPEPRRRRLEAEMDRYRERMPLLSRIGDDAVYEIVDAPS